MGFLWPTTSNQTESHYREEVGIYSLAPAKKLIAIEGYRKENEFSLMDEIKYCQLHSKGRPQSQQELAQTK